jgi:hypothetical protein
METVSTVSRTHQAVETALHRDSSFHRLKPGANEIHNDRGKNPLTASSIMLISE